MNRIVGALILDVFWIAVTGSASLPNIVFGFLLGMLCLYIVREHATVPIGKPRPIALIILNLVFIRELILSAWRVLVLVLQPRMELKPCIFAYPLEVERDFEITLLANMITLTPGTLSIDVSPDRKLLFVHAIDCSDVDAAIADIRRTFEQRIIRAFHR